jgi:16S rRNA (cytidine1402-2'-O)-methyltransferase
MAPSRDSPDEDTNSSHHLSPGLYITATPIGNSGDITLRALSVLKNCDAIVAEDTRVTARLLSLYGISRPLLIYHEHNATSAGPKLLARLRDGQKLALVTDAGTPLISDPGYRLVSAAREEGIRVFPVPGPSAVVAAISACGLPCEQFMFAGFVSSRAGERKETLKSLRSVVATLIFFEAPHRLADTLGDMAKVFGPREAAVARELTKIHEEFRRGALLDLASHYAATQARGEVVVVVAPPADEPGPDLELIDSLLAQALRFMPVKPAAALVAEATSAGRRDVYSRALKLSRNIREDDA